MRFFILISQLTASLVALLVYLLVFQIETGEEFVCPNEHTLQSGLDSECCTRICGQNMATERHQLRETLSQRDQQKHQLDAEGSNGKLNDFEIITHRTPKDAS